MNRLLKIFIVGIVILTVAGASGGAIWNLHKFRTVQLFGNLVSRVKKTEKVVALMMILKRPGFVKREIEKTDNLIREA